jgi:Major Facilitator Superfamily
MSAAMPDAASSPKPTQSLWRHRDFMMLWSGQAISELGAAVSTVALPLTAVVLLHASTFGVGLLTTAGTISFLLVALPAGLIVDRIAKRRLMIGCDIARMLVIGSVPAAALLGALTMAQLFAVALLVGLATVFFDVAYQSYLPVLIEPAKLHDGNGKLGATQSFAQVAGPGLGGGLFSVLPAGALAVNSFSYALSWLSLLLIRTPESAPVRASAGAGDGTHGKVAALRAELFAGLAFVLRHPVLRKVAACTGTANLFGSMAGTLEIIFLIRVLRVSPADTGALIAIGSVGGILGGILSGRLSRWIGSARIIWFSMLVFGAIPILMPLAAPGARLAFFPVAGAGLSFTAVVYNVAQVSYRQMICPPELLGRMNAAIRWIVWGTLPLGGLSGGLLGSAGVLGIRGTLWLAVTGGWAAGFWVLFSPLRRMRDIPVTDQAACDPVAVPAPR